jgi:DNA-directed RNA polymerase subunit RPC12/RpoP
MDNNTDTESLPCGVIKATKLPEIRMQSRTDTTDYFICPKCGRDVEDWPSDKFKKVIFCPYPNCGGKFIPVRPRIVGQYNKIMEYERTGIPQIVTKEDVLFDAVQFKHMSLAIIDSENKIVGSGEVVYKNSKYYMVIVFEGKFTEEELTDLDKPVWAVGGQPNDPVAD